VTGRKKAAAGTLLFLVAAPGVVAGFIPWRLTSWRTPDVSPYWLSLRAVGLILVAAGAGALLHAFARFVSEGIGTPAPVAPTNRLVVGGLYRYVRNPMYLAVGSIIVGQAIWFLSWELVIYAVAFSVAVATFVHFYEEPTLARQFGEEYERYRRVVPAWWPRRHPWDPSISG
jgi:protein-S-isoprenylcysteine O-methyltransferase Ste14